MKVRYLWLTTLVNPLIAVLAFIGVFDLKYDLVGWSFILTAVQSALMLGFAATRSANLLTIYALFSFVFLGLIPWLHYSAQVVIWRSYPLALMTYVDVNFAIFFANLTTAAAYVLTSSNQRVRIARLYTIRRRQLTSFMLLTLSLLGFWGVLHLNGYNFRLLLFRGLVDQTRDVMFTSSSVALVFGMVARLLPAFAFYFAVTELKKAWFLKIVLFGILLFAVFPTGVARYLVAYAYIPVLMVMVPDARKGSVFAVTFLASLLFIFPVLNQFRYFDGFDRVSLLPSKDFFFAAHFDAYENFGSAVEAHFVTFGYQLVGVLLFFVPRAFWPDKPVGSGYEMANSQDYVFNNISMPFLGEGYINFGIVGVILFAGFIGYAMARVDRARTLRQQVGERLRYDDLIYYFLFGAVFFVLRGDLLSSFAYLSAGLVVAWFVGTLLRFLNREVRR